MASLEQEAPGGTSPHSADIVGNAFVHQYYLILHKSPEVVHRFYQDSSKLGRPGENGEMSITTSMQAINEKICSLDYGEYTAEIVTVDAQDSYNGGVLVLVTGYLIGKDSVGRKFTQSFFLAPQEKGYFVLNDVFRYVEDTKHSNGDQGPVNDVEAPLIPNHDPLPMQENHISEQKTELVNPEEVYNTYENGGGSIVEDETKVPEVADEISDDSQIVIESNFKTEEIPKKSYASILKVMKESSVHLSTAPPAPASAPTSTPVKSITKSQEQKITVVPPPAPVSEVPISGSNVVENGNNQESEADGYSIYIKGLPLSTTHSLLENEFKKFGLIKSGGIQVKSQKGVCFGFVEFEVASAVQSAIEASPMMIGGRQAVVEEKRSTRGSNRGRFSSGRGFGFRNEGGRGRGNYGGRGYIRGDFYNRTEFGNRGGGRGGFSNRGGDGYQRADSMGSNDGRVNRTGALTANATARTMAVRVSASA